MLILHIGLAGRGTKLDQWRGNEARMWPALQQAGLPALPCHPLSLQEASGSWPLHSTVPPACSSLPPRINISCLPHTPHLCRWHLWASASPTCAPCPSLPPSNIPTALPPSPLCRWHPWTTANRTCAPCPTCQPA